jgi:hypothetical protein
LTVCPSPNPAVCFNHSHPWGSLFPSPRRPARRSRVGLSPVQLRSEELRLPGAGGGYPDERLPVGPRSDPLPRLCSPAHRPEGLLAGSQGRFRGPSPGPPLHPPRWLVRLPAPRVLLRVPPVTGPLAQTFAR